MSVPAMSWTGFEKQARKWDQFVPEGAKQWIRDCYACPNLSRRWRTFDEWWECVHCYRTSAVKEEL